MYIMERIGWWFLRHSTPVKIYHYICPNCNILNTVVIKGNKYPKDQVCRNCKVHMYMVKEEEQI